MSTELFWILRQRQMALLVVQQLLIGAICVTASSVYNSMSVQLQYGYDLYTGESQTWLLFTLCVLLYESSFQLDHLAGARGFPCSRWNQQPFGDVLCTILWMPKCLLASMLSYLAAARLAVTPWCSFFSVFFRGVEGRRAPPPSNPMHRN